LNQPKGLLKAKVKNQGLFYLYLEAVSIMNSKSQSLSEDSQDGKSSSTRGASSLNIQSFTSRDLEFIVKFAEEHGSDIFRQILHSICPSIYGHELVKAGITLALFGGVQKHLMDQNKVPVRGDIHVIIVGKFLLTCLYDCDVLFNIILKSRIVFQLVHAIFLVHYAKSTVVFRTILIPSYRE